MSLKKTVAKDNPHAVFVNRHTGWTYLVLKTYQNPDKEFSSTARWHVAVQSPFTFGSYEMGDAYVFDVLGSGAKLVAATTEWNQVYGLDPLNPLPTPRQWFNANDVTV